MMRFHGYFAALPWLMALLRLPAPAGSQAQISAACGSADAVVIANLRRESATAVPHMTVLEAIKGQVTANTAFPVTLPSFQMRGTPSGMDLTAVAFLKQDESGWRLIFLAGDNAPPGDQFLPAGEVAPVEGRAPASCEDEVLARTLAGLNDRNVAWHRLPVLGWFHGYDSASYREQLGKLSSAANPEFRAMGLGGRFALGDIAALQQLLEEAPRFQSATLMELGITLGGFRNPDAKGIAELGRIAGLSEAKYARLAQGAAYSLHALHTLESLPILYRLLDSPDPKIRLEAMFGFAKFAANFPIQRPEDGPSHRNATPLSGGKYTTGDGESHFPRIGGQNEDTRAFWKAWYESNFLNR